MNSMKPGKYRFLRLRGTPIERGRQYGQACRVEIAHSIASYSAMFESFLGLTWDQARQRISRYLPYAENFSPKALEEIEGVAQGAGISFEDMFTLNCRSEIVMEQRVDGCTAFGVSPRVSGDGKSYLCQNWDWISRQRKAKVIIQLEQPPEPTLLMVAEAGILAGKGLNSEGIGMVANALSTGCCEPGVPVHFLLRKVLESPTLSDAVESVAVARRANCVNFLLGTHEGDFLDIEAAPEDFGVLTREEGGFLCHTNHFLAPNLVCRVRDYGKVILPDTFQRLGRIRDLIRERAGQVDLAACREFLSDHRNAPDSICRHEDEHDPEGKRLGSVYGVILDLAGRVLWISDGNPCQGRFFPYTFLTEESLAPE
jgi:isopenicillin-N N-acyltransferase-like protein